MTQPEKQPPTREVIEINNEIERRIGDRAAKGHTQQNLALFELQEWIKERYDI